MNQKPKARAKPAPHLAKKDGAARPPGPASKDAVLIHGVSEDGQTLAVLRAREDRVEAGLIRAVREGEPVDGELVKLTPRPEAPLVCDVEVQVPAGAVNARGGSDAPAQRGRPAQVATDSYRENWDAIWSKPRGGKKALSN